MNTMNTDKTNNFVNCLKEHKSNVSLTNGVKHSRCNLCCRNFSSEGYYEYHLKKYHRGVARENFAASNKLDSVKNCKPNGNDATRRPNFIWNGFINTVPFDLKYEKIEYTVCPMVSANVIGHTESEQRHFPRENTVSRETVTLINSNNNYSAPIVNYATRTPAPLSDLDEHIRAVQEFCRVEVHEFDCEFCKKSCLDPLHFELHQWCRKDVHTLLVCPTCCQSFTKQSHLDEHKIRHIAN